MKGEDFRKSSWCKYAESPENQEKISKSFTQWSERVKNTGIMKKAKELFDFFKSSEITAGEKMLVGGALLYIISPLDLMPDGIPLVGWLDDLGIAAFALQYVHDKLEKVENSALMDSEIASTSEKQVYLPEMSSPQEFSLNHDMPTGKLGSYIKELRAICDELSIPNAENYLNTIESRLHDTYLLRMAVIGRFSSGKSSLINGLLDKKILPTGNLPTTKAITYIVKGPNDMLCSEAENGEIIVHDSIDVLLNKKDKVIAEADTITLALRDFPFEGLSIVDTPGLNDITEKNSQLTHDIICECDAIVVLMDASYFQAKDDLDFAQQLYHSGDGRKLYFVVNKIDKLATPEDEKTVRENCEKELIKRGISFEQLYLVSAKDTDVGFNSFRDELFAFLKKSLKNASYQHTENELKSYARQLKRSCTTALKLTAFEEEKRQKIISQTHSVYQEREKSFDKKVQKLRSKYNHFTASYFSEFNKYIQQLKAEVTATIMSSDLQSLQNKDLISSSILAKLRGYIDKSISEFAKDFQHAVTEVQTEIINELTDIKFPVDVKIVDLSSWQKSIIPASLLITYFTGGLFAFLQGALIVLIGRDAIDNFLTSIFTQFGQNAKKQLSSHVSAQLDSSELQIKGMLGEKFESMFKSIEDSLREHMLGSSMVQLVTESTTQSRIDKIDECYKKLNMLIS